MPIELARLLARSDGLPAIAVTFLYLHLRTHSDVSESLASLVRQVSSINTEDSGRFYCPCIRQSYIEGSINAATVPVIYLSSGPLVIRSNVPCLSSASSKAGLGAFLNIFGLKNRVASRPALLDSVSR